MNTNGNINRMHTSPAVCCFVFLIPSITENERITLSQTAGEKKKNPERVNPDEGPEWLIKNWPDEGQQP